MKKHKARETKDQSVEINLSPLSGELHAFDVGLASIYGVHESIMIHHFLFWIRFNIRTKKNFIEDRTWTYQTLEDIASHFPYLSKAQVFDILEKLTLGRGRRSKIQGFDPVLLKANFNKVKYDRTIWYGFIDEEKWQMPKSILANAKMENGNCQSPDCEMPTPIPDTKPESKTEENNIKSNQDESLPFVLLSSDDYKDLESTYGAEDLNWMMKYLSDYKIKNPHKRRNNDRDAIERWVWQPLDQHKGKATFEEQKSKEIDQRKQWSENNQWTGTGGCGVATMQGFEVVSGSITKLYAYDKNNKFWTDRGI